MKFVEIVVPGNCKSHHPWVVEGKAAELFKKMLSETHLVYWKPGDPILHAAIRFLIGVFDYKVYDLRLIDELARIPAAVLNRARIDIFNIYDVQSKEEVEFYYPGADLQIFLQTPTVGLWRGGQFVTAKHGPEGRVLLSSSLGLEHYGIDLDACYT